jgi:hypothetical protein
MEQENNDTVILYEAPKIIPPEFRLYYDDKGKVICYTCEKLEGNYIVIDAQTFAIGRPDVRVVNGKLSTVASHLVISKLQPHDSEGIDCHVEDMSIIVEPNVDVETQKWNLITNEY